MANKPLILSDNLYDDVVLHPDHLVFHTGTAVAGSEVFHVADNLRDITRFTIAESNLTMSTRVDVGVGATKAASMLVLDRGHNVKGKTVRVFTSPDNIAFTLRAQCVVPSSAGGLPTDTNGCLTPDGVFWKTFASASARYWAVDVVGAASFTPILTGLYLGDSYRFPEYLNAPAAYDYRLNHKVRSNEMSLGGVRVKRGILNFAEVDLNFSLEGTDFPAFYAEAERLLRYNHPWWFCLDDSDTVGAGLMRLFQLPGDTVFDPQVNPVHREVRLLLEEVIPTLSI